MNEITESRTITVVRTIHHRGGGTADDPHRRVTSYWSPEGAFLAESDPYHEARPGRSVRRACEWCSKDFFTHAGSGVLCDSCVQRFIDRKGPPNGGVVAP